MSTDPRQHIADALLRMQSIVLGEDKDTDDAVASDLIDALLPGPGAVVLVRHEDGTTTSTPVKPARTGHSRKGGTVPIAGQWREVPDEQ